MMLLQGRLELLSDATERFIHSGLPALLTASTKESGVAAR
jgi:hypothetical protein